MRHHPHIVLVRLVDERPIEIGRELRHGAVAVVDPDLDQVGLVCGEFADVLARFLLGGDAIGAVAHDPTGACIGHAESAAGGEVARARARFGAHAVRQVAATGAGLEHRSDAVEGIAVEHVEQVVAGVVVGGEAGAGAIAHVHVIVDQRGHHRLAGEVDPRRAGRWRQLPAPADADEPVIGDDEGRVLDDDAVAGEKPCALVDGDGGSLGVRGVRRGQQRQRRNERGERTPKTATHLGLLDRR